MREIEVSQITDIVEKLCIAANEHLPEDVKCAIRSCRACEDGQIAQGILDNIIENFEIADNECVPICQDTGMACVFLEIGQDVHFVGGDLTEAVNEGVRRGYDKGYLRKSVVKDPVRPGRQGEDHRWPEGLRQREHEPDPYVQAVRRLAGYQGLYP